MKSEDEPDQLRRRLILAGIVALCAVALTVADRLVASDAGAVVNDFSAAHAGSEHIDAAIDAQLARYQVERNSMTTWRVLTPEKQFLRVEQRIVVPSDFASVEFNHELNRQLLPYGARVAATERSKEKVVAMHILKRGVIIRTMSFAMRPKRPDARTERAKSTTKRTAH